MEQELINAGWQKISANQYTHQDGRSLERREGKWCFWEPGWKKPRTVGRTLKDAIKSIMEVKVDA